MKINVYLLMFSVLSACSVPDNNDVLKDFNNMFSAYMPDHCEPEGIDIFTGEGDADNVYKHINFGFKCNQDEKILNEWLAGETVKSDKQYVGWSVVILYQKKDGRWRKVFYELQKNQRKIKNN